MVKSGENYQAKKSSIEMQMVISKFLKLKEQLVWVQIIQTDIGFYNIKMNMYRWYVSNIYLYIIVVIESVVCCV